MCRVSFPTSPAGMIQFSDFWDTVARNVDVVRADIDRLEEHTIILADGSSLDADAILLGTGYKDVLPFFSEKDAAALGLPHDEAVEDPAETNDWTALESVAQKKVIELYPALGSKDRKPEHFGDINLKMTPFRLYRGVGPLNVDPTIAFPGFIISPNMFESAEITALWAVGYLDGNVSLPPLEDMRKEIAYVTAYLKLRLPTYGRIGNFYLYDKFAHQAQLLDKDLGLKSWYPKTWRKRWLAPVLPRDFKGIKDEYLEKYGAKTAGKEEDKTPQTTAV
jgi:dimethylaniline monooxygenase (N-oxide forming)